MNGYGWDWSRLAGSARGLMYNHRDLPALDAVLRLVPGRTAVVQAGGNLGLFPKRLAQEFAAVYTFEPDPALFALLQANAPEPRIIKLQAALGAERRLVGTSAARRDGKGGGKHEGLTHVDGPGVIPTLRVDDLGLPACDLIYLDVEGCEIEALAGAAKTITRCRPVLGVEVHPLEAGYSGRTVEDVRRHIAAHSYRAAGGFLSDEFFVPEAT